MRVPTTLNKSNRSTLKSQQNMDSITFEDYYKNYLESFKNYYGSSCKKTELGNIHQFWTSLLELIQMTYIKNINIRNLDLNGFIRFNMKLQLEETVLPQAKGVLGGHSYLRDQKYILVEDLKKARGIKNNLVCDAYVHSTKTLIEQKANRLTLDQELDADASKNRIHILSAYHQALMYTCYFPEGKAPKRIVTSNFEEIWVYEDLWQKNVVKVPVKGIENYWDVLLPILYDGGNQNEKGFKP